MVPSTKRQNVIPWKAAPHDSPSASQEFSSTGSACPTNRFVEEQEQTPQQRSDLSVREEGAHSTSLGACGWGLAC